MIRAIVVTYNSSFVIGACLEALLAVAHEADLCGGLEVVVVDNASSDDTTHIAQRVDPTVVVVATGGNLGYAAAVNIGWRTAPAGAHVLILNPDIRLQPGSLTALIGALGSVDERGRRVGMAVPRLLADDGSPQWSLRREPTVLRSLGEAIAGGDRAGRRSRWGERVTTPETYERAATVDWASGAALLVDRGAFDAIGPWDESFFLYSEETDFCLRARQLGWAVRYVPTAIAVHLGGDLHTSAPLYALLLANRVRLHRGRRGRVAAELMRIALLLNEVFRLARPSGLHRKGLRTLLGGERSRRAIIASLQGVRRS